MNESKLENQKVVTVKAAAELLSVSVRTVWRMIADGQLHAVRVRRCTRLSVSEVLTWIEGSKQGGCA